MADNVAGGALANGPRRAAVRRGSAAGVDACGAALRRSPVPGDPIMGFVTIGRGVSVHRGDCPNVAYLNAAPERILDAQWAGLTTLQHAVDIEIEANDRPGLLQDIMGVCAELKTNASSVNARVKKENAMISITAQISDLDHLHTLLRKLSNIRDVRTVYRVTKREARASGG